MIVIGKLGTGWWRKMDKGGMRIFDISEVVFIGTGWQHSNIDPNVPSFNAYEYYFLDSTPH